MKPTHVTLTGLDSWTPMREVVALARDYPVEFGVLLSPTRSGRYPRFPELEHVARLKDYGLDLSAHLCGGYAAAVMERRYDGTPPEALTRGFKRVQVNHVRPDPAARAYAELLNPAAPPEIVLQCRGWTFSDARPGVAWLFDRSGGRGVPPASWPPHPGRWVGYAGGLTPENVVEVVTTVGVPVLILSAPPAYWLDVESGVRDAHDHFDVTRARHLLREIYG